MIELYDFQKDIVGSVVDLFAAKKKRVVLASFMGTGKTIMSAHVCKHVGAKRVLFLSHLLQLKRQASDEFKRVGVDVDSETVQGSAKCDGYDIVIVDECHHVTPSSRAYEKIKDHPMVLGLTGTPWRADKIGLRDVFDGIADGPSVQRLIYQGFLIAPKTMQFDTIDLQGLKIEGGELVENKEFSDRMILLNGDVVNEFKRNAMGKRAMAFCVDVAHCQRLASDFKAKGVRAVAVHGNMTEKERSDILDDFKSGKIDVITNCMLYTEGFNYPQLDTIILARPFLSSGLYVQVVGRVMRACDKKTSALVLDHGKNHERHKDIAEYVTLSSRFSGTIFQKGKQDKKENRDLGDVVKCGNCEKYAPKDFKCIHCGEFLIGSEVRGDKRKGSEIASTQNIESKICTRKKVPCGVCTDDGENTICDFETAYERQHFCFTCMHKYRTSKIFDVKDAHTDDGKKKVLHNLTAEAVEKNYKPAYIAYKFFEFYGESPVKPEYFLDFECQKMTEKYQSMSVFATKSREFTNKLHSRGESIV